MSTEIRGFASGKVRGRLTQETNCVYIALAGEDGNWRGLATPTDDLMAAVAAECDAIVIPRTDLPEVTVRTIDGDTGYGIDGDYYTDNYPHREEALRRLAIAEYLDAHPPVDEAQVEAVTAALYEATADPDDIEVPAVARRLVERGVRIEARP